MGKKIKYIAVILIVLGLGYPLRNGFVNHLKENSLNSNFSQIKKSLEKAPELSIWGSSTAYINFDAHLLGETLNVSCYNFGISGAFYNQLTHLKNFARNNKNKHIIWVINPYEFKGDVDSKLNPDAYFTPFYHEFGNPIINFFGWNQIYHFNAEHWSIILKKTTPEVFNEYGNQLMNKPFCAINGYHEDVTPFNFSAQKIDELNVIIHQLQQNNKLTLVIPPYLGNALFSEFIDQVNTPLLDYSKSIKAKEDFHDYIHLNKSGAKKLTKILAKDLKSILK